MNKPVQPLKRLLSLTLAALLTLALLPCGALAAEPEPDFDGYLVTLADPAAAGQLADRGVTPLFDDCCLVEDEALAR
ncbi:MAG: hypothetical protein HUJ67_03250, partial [Ruminiclostridium sp.]|nr:hypothetical protein [Ruminiclostridium sp.]